MVLHFVESWPPTGSVIEILAEHVLDIKFMASLVFISCAAEGDTFVMERCGGVTMSFILVP
ncbi:protein of unknown function [Vibrio tapetis subsp. tapetis]|uniref:Uncharacterized protein n=1 Tax=Vibrio tapetis subsp. tapetis TaxID=1671868 RepID=A0A2N8ZKR5_9VIBR|nr:protein of unknown function [Vibrio tapetis subsp. tapetis]